MGKAGLLNEKRGGDSTRQGRWREGLSEYLYYLRLGLVSQKIKSRSTESRIEQQTKRNKSALILSFESVVEWGPRKGNRED